MISLLLVFGCKNDDPKNENLKYEKEAMIERYNSLVTEKIKEIEKFEKDSFEVMRQFIRIGEKSINNYVTYDRIDDYVFDQIERYHVCMKVNGVYKNIVFKKINFKINFNLKKPVVKLLIDRPSFANSDGQDEFSRKIDLDIIKNLQKPIDYYKNTTEIVFCSNNEKDFEIFFLPNYAKENNSKE